MTAKTKITWRMVRLGDMGKIITGKTPPTKEPDNFGGKYPFITIPDLKGQKYITSTERTVSEKGAGKLRNIKLPFKSVVVSCLATVGKVGITTRESFTNQQINAVIPEPDIADSDFLYYVFRKLKPRLEQYDGSVYTNISKTKFENIEIELPNIDDQKHIAEVLSAFDEKIESNNRIIKTLEEMAQAIFKEWFVNFRFPRLRRGFGGQAGHEKAEFVDSALGKIPKGWEVKKLGDVLELAYGKALKEQDRKSGNVAVIGSSGIVGSHNQRLVSGPGIVVGRKGVAGSVIWIDEDFYPIDTTFYVKTKLPLTFCFLMLKRQNFITGDSTVPGLNREDAERNVVLAPDSKSMEQFREIADPIFHQEFHLQKENQKLAAMRDLLLPRLMSGAIRV